MVNCPNPILVVDDDESFRDYVVELLNTHEYPVMVASSGHEALRLLADIDMSLVLLDACMTGLDGFAVLRRIRDTSSMARLPVIMVTGLGDRDHIVEALKMGANDYLVKPLDPAITLARVETQLSLNELAKQNDEYLGIVTHDLKKPLALIVDAITMLQEEGKEKKLDVREVMDTLGLVERSATAMKSLVEDFLDVKVMESGKLEFEQLPMDLNEVAHDAVSGNEDYAKKKGIFLINRLAPRLPPVSVDRKRLAQVLDNLVGNAIKFSEAATEVCVASHVSNGWCWLEVQDQGPGFATDELGRVFERYPGLRNKPTGGENSTGMGLFICKGLVECQGGRLEVDNNPDRGATFRIGFPVVAADQISAC